MSIVLSVAASSLLVACGSSSSGSDGDKSRVVASFYPLAFAAEEAGGTRVSVRNLTPPGAEPHDLEVSPRDVGALRSADLVLLLGGGFQPQLERAAGSGRHVLRLLDVPGLRRFPNGDPHVWLDPLRYAVVVRRVAAALGVERAGERLTARLLALHRAYRSGLSSCARRELVTSHEAFAYLAERYRLRQIAISGPSPEAEPAPGAVARVVSLVRRTHATTIFFETLVSPRVAQTVAREAGARTAALDPIEGLTAAEARRGDDYFSLMRSNLASLRRGLGCR